MKIIISDNNNLGNLNMKLIPKAQTLFVNIIEELDNPSCSMYEDAVTFSDEEKYNILRYLTNMLEAEEEKLWKQINENTY